MPRLLGMMRVEVSPKRRKIPVEHLRGRKEEEHKQNISYHKFLTCVNSMPSMCTYNHNERVAILILDDAPILRALSCCEHACSGLAIKSLQSGGSTISKYNTGLLILKHRPSLVAVANHCDGMIRSALAIETIRSLHPTTNEFVRLFQ